MNGSTAARVLIALALLVAACGDGETPPDPCAQCTADASCAAVGSAATCSCPAGFTGDGTVAGTGCANIDECAAGACVVGATCQDTAGSFSCACPAGYVGDGAVAGSGCADVDECATGDVCGSAAICANSQGSYQCRGLYAPSPFNNHVYRLKPDTLEVLETIDPVLGDEVLIGATSFAEHPVTGAAYAVVRIGSARRLARFDAVAQAYSDTVALSDRFASIAFDADGTLFGVTGNGAAVPETLYQIDPLTGEATLVVALGAGSDGEVIQFNPDDGRLYHWSGGTSFYQAITMASPYEVQTLSSTFNREVFGARWDADAHDFVVFDIASAARRFATDGTFSSTDLATFPDDLRSPATAEAPPHSLSPATGDVAGGVAVTLLGSGFSKLGDSTTVNFGAATATGTVVDDHHITVTSPVSSVAGAVNVTISAGAYRFGWPGGFTYTGTPTLAPLQGRSSAPDDADAPTGGAADADAELSGGCAAGGSGTGALLLAWIGVALLWTRRR